MAQSSKKAIKRGSIKNKDFPIELFKNSSDFRGAVSAKAPITRSPATVRIVAGDLRTKLIFFSHASKLISRGTLTGVEIGATAFGDDVAEFVGETVGEFVPLAILLKVDKCSRKRHTFNVEGGMEFASLQEAFPESKKKSKKQKDQFQAYDLPPTDPDRPAVKRMMEVPPVNQPQPNAEDPMDDYLDESTKFQKKQNVNNSLPKPRSMIALETPALPSFFGAEPFTNPNEDTMSPFNSHVDHPNGYMLDSDFTKAFDEKPGFGKSSGSTLPTPELRQRWKPLSVDRIDTAFTNSEKNIQFAGLDTGDIKAMKSKIDSLIARLDDLEYRAAGANPQLEMLSFIMTGLFLMFALDITVRKTSGAL